MLTVDLRDDGADLAASGVHGRDNVVAVVAGQGHKGVHLGDALLAQQLGVCAVAVDDQHAGEFLAHFLAAGRIVVNDGDPLLDVLQLLDQIVQGVSVAVDNVHQGVGGDIAGFK